MKLACALALPAALFALACGGEDNGRPPPGDACRPILFPLEDYPDPGSGPVACDALDGYEIWLINDFESGTTGPAWYFNNDRTAAQKPAADTDALETAMIPGGRCVGAAPSPDAPTLCDNPEIALGQCTTPMALGSRNAIHIQTGLMTNGGGVTGHITQKDCSSAGIEECPFRPGPPELGPCGPGLAPSSLPRGCHALYDTTGWEGVVLWARVGPGSASSIRVRASDARTDDKGCFCNPYTNQNDTSDGCDKFGRFVGLDLNWRAYFVPFAEMQQGGWGLKSPGLDSSDLFEIVIEYGRGAWDLWIDDVGLYRRRQ